MARSLLVACSPFWLVPAQAPRPRIEPVGAPGAGPRLRPRGQGGLRLDVWTVNDPAVARRMVELGVDGSTTDRPGWLREQLKGR